MYFAALLGLLKGLVAWGIEKDQSRFMDAVKEDTKVAVVGGKDAEESTKQR